MLTPVQFITLIGCFLYCSCSFVSFSYRYDGVKKCVGINFLFSVFDVVVGDGSGGNEVLDGDRKLVDDNVTVNEFIDECKVVDEVLGDVDDKVL